MCQTHPLSRLAIGGRAVVRGLSPFCPMRRRLLDLGLVNGTEVSALQRSPSGDPTAYFIRGTVIALRAEDAACVLVEPTP